ncbi:MAG TPA: hypothetical protein PJ982_14745 [Lacipirellulaceae bacterium]|nr:hypothetical protein [Lacipirellulaceae bacterium]
MSEITLEQARKVLEITDAGLIAGLGSPEPGAVCVEAAVCLALGMPHGDEPSCKSAAVRAFDINLNNSPHWSSSSARAAGMRRLQIAGLGSDGIDEARFAQLLALGMIRRVLLVVLRAAGLDEQVTACEAVSGLEAAREAAAAAREAAREAAASASASALAEDRDAVLTLAAEVAVNALRECGSPGVALMDELCPARA